MWLMPVFGKLPMTNMQVKCARQEQGSKGFKIQAVGE
jgi:hypothetical protein